MKILVTGASGQLGSELVRLLGPAAHEVITPGRAELDLLQTERIAAVIERYRPDQVINCAAYTAVDRAETEVDSAFAINRDAAGELAVAAARCGARVLHVSTDFVFDGRQTRPYREDDTAAPLGVYGRSKLAGEQAVMQACPDAVVLRTAWVYGCNGHNFVKTVLRHALAGKPLRVVADQTGTPTWAQNIAGVLVRLAERSDSGLFHYTDAGSTSWHGFACAILEQARAAGYSIRTRTVEPIATRDWPTAAARPAYSVLDTTRIAERLSLTIPQWRDSLADMLKELAACADCL